MPLNKLHTAANNLLADEYGLKLISGLASEGLIDWDSFEDWFNLNVAIPISEGENEGTDDNGNPVSLDYPEAPRPVTTRPHFN